MGAPVLSGEGLLDHEEEGMPVAEFVTDAGSSVAGEGFLGALVGSVLPPGLTVLRSGG